MPDTDQNFTFTHPVLLAFTGSLLTPRAQKDNKGNVRGEPRHEINLLFDPDHPDYDTIKQIIRDVAAGHHDPSLGKLGLPIKSGTAMADKRNAKLAAMSPPKEPDREYLRGKIVLIARSKYPPLLSRIIGGKIIELHDAARVQNASAFFPGAEALAQVRFAWYEPSPLVPGGGVNAFLNQVLVTGKGTRFPGTGGRSASEAFKGYAGHVSDIDPLAGSDSLDDEIPF